jgi:hypothetical protein
MSSETGVKQEVENRLSTIRTCITETQTKLASMRNEESIFLAILRNAEKKAEAPVAVAQPVKRKYTKHAVKTAKTPVVFNKPKKVTLTSAITQVLTASGKPMNITQILAGVEKVGHKSKAKNVKQTVYTAVHNMLKEKQISKEKKGVYCI